MEKVLESTTTTNLMSPDCNVGTILTSALQDGQVLIRKKLLYSAVNFLNNPRLHLTSTDEKNAFLLKKGLTQDEIDLVFQLCITRPSTEAALSSELDLLTSSLYSNSSLPPTSNTFFGKLLRFVFCLTVFGSFAYGSYTLYQNIIRPYFDKSQQSQKTPNEETREQIRELSEQIIELNRNVSIVHEFVRTYCRARDDSLLSLKNELGSIKSLLVSRNNFPSVPTIPKWQLDNSSKKSALTAKNGTGDHSNSASDSSDSLKSD